MATEKDTQGSIFDLDEFSPYLELWNERINILSQREGYYTGKVYQKTFERLAPYMGGTDKVKGRIKPLYLPLASAVDIDVGLIPGGWQVKDDVPDNMVLLARAIMKQSSWKTDGILYVEYGAKFGITGLKISDIRASERVHLSPVDPTKFLPIWGDGYETDRSPKLVIYKEMRGHGDERYEYAEATTPEAIRTFKNGVTYEFDGRPDNYENELEFVPFVQVKHIENGSSLGESTFDKAIPMLNEVNVTASNLGQIIEDHSSPQWAVMAEPADLDRSGDNVWFFPDGGDAKAMVAPVDISGVLEFIREIAGNVKEALPESMFGELLKKKMVATETLEIQLYPLVIKMRKRCRPNYDDGLERAFVMIGKAGVSMGLGEEYQQLADGIIEFDEERPVLPMDPMTKLKLEMLQEEKDNTSTFYSGNDKVKTWGDDLDEEDLENQDDE